MLTRDDLDQLLKLRVIVARFGEMDLAGWWNTRGQLGRLGTATLHRGMPRTHYFAQARSVFAVAGNRCRDYYDPPQSVTLWSLSPAIEQAFDARWERWLDEAAQWTPFFETVEQLAGDDLAAALGEANLIGDEQSRTVSSLEIQAQGRAAQLPGVFDESIESITLLALGFSLGSKGALTVPYMAAGPTE